MSQQLWETHTHANCRDMETLSLTYWCWIACHETKLKIEVHIPFQSARDKAESTRHTSALDSRMSTGQGQCAVGARTEGLGVTHTQPAKAQASGRTQCCEAALSMPLRHPQRTKESAISKNGGHYKPTDSFKMIKQIGPAPPGRTCTCVSNHVTEGLGAKVNPILSTIRFTELGDFCPL